MSKQLLIDRLLHLAKAGLGEANKGNCFWSKGDAMSSLKSIRAIRKGQA